MNHPDERAKTLDPYLRDVVRFPDTTVLSDVMNQLISRRRHLALITGASGQIIGMLTFEDVLEEIVGEIEEKDALPAEKPDREPSA